MRFSKTYTTSAFLFLFFSVVSVSATAQDFPVRFVIKNAGFKVDGHFDKFTTDVVYDANNLDASKFYGEIQTTSINTDNGKRDKHLRNEDYFEVAKYPTITFTSSNVKSAGTNKLTVTGTLKIKNMSKIVAIPVTLKNVGGKTTFSGELTINRRDYGVGGSSWVLSDKLTIYLDITK